MSSDGDGFERGRPVPPIADVVNLVDIFATDCRVEHRGEYTRLIFSTEAGVPGPRTIETELIPATRVVMTPSGFMKLAEAVLTHLGYVKRTPQ